MSDNIKSNISNERLLSVRNVRGTNEDLINLSSKFPNVLFYAENTSAGVLKDNNNKDLYLGGFKYTRFHGLGKNMVTIGENRIILSFDESSGLLSIALNSSIDAMWLCGIDDKNSISNESSLSEIKSCIISNDPGYNNISNYTYSYEDSYNTDHYGMIMFNRGNYWNNGTFMPNDNDNGNTDGNDSVTLLFALVSESNDLPNIQFNIQSNNLVSFSEGEPFMISTPNSGEDLKIFNDIIGQVDDLSLSDKQKLYICPIKVSILNSGVLIDSNVQIDQSILIPVEDNNDTYRSNFYNNLIISALNPDITDDDSTNLQNFNIFDTSPVTSSYDNVLLKCNMFVESTIRKIDLTGDADSTSNNNEFKITLTITVNKNTEHSNSIVFNNNELVKFLIDKQIMKFAIKIEKNNNNPFEGIFEKINNSSEEIFVINNENNTNSEYGYIMYEDGSYVYHNTNKNNLLTNGLKNINIFLLVNNADNNHPKFPLIKFIVKKDDKSINRLYPLFVYDNNLNYFIQPSDPDNLSSSLANDKKSKCIAGCNVVTTKAVTKILLTPSSVTINPNETRTITATIKPNNATYKDVTWSSSNPLVATVDSDGKVTGVNEGTATIICTSKSNSSITATCEVRCVAATVAVTGISVNESELSVAANGTGTLIATIEPTDATYKDVTWSSSDPSVATVTSSTTSGNAATVTWKKAGTVTITAKAAGDTTKTAICTVTCETATVQSNYYWYAGQTQPTSMTSNPTVDDTNFTNNKWHTLNTNQINKTITGGTAGNSWYVAVPTDKSFKAYASDMAAINNTWKKLSTITINSNDYDIWKPNSTGAKMNIYMK